MRSASAWFRTAGLVATLGVVLGAAIGCGASEDRDAPSPEGVAAALPAGAIDENAFWRIVEATSAPDPDTHAANVVATLERGTAAQIEQYEAAYVKVYLRAHDWLHLRAGDIAIGQMSDDVAEDFYAWLIYHGRAVWQRFVDDPDSLAGVMKGVEPDDTDGELLAFAPDDAYAKVKGDDAQLEARDAIYDEPSGERVSDRPTTLRRLYPRLTEEFGTSLEIR